MAAQKKTIIKRALLRVMGDSRSEGVYILVVIEYRNGNRSQMRGLPGEGFCISKPLMCNSASFTSRESTVAFTVWTCSTALASGNRR